MRRQAHTVSALTIGALFFIGCAETPGPAEAPTSTTTGDAQAQQTTEAAPEEASSLELARAVAQKTADAWQVAKAKEENATYVVKIRVDGKVSGLRANGENAVVIEGTQLGEAADVTIELKTEQAAQIASGERSLLDLIPYV